MKQMRAASPANLFVFLAAVLLGCGCDPPKPSTSTQPQPSASAPAASSSAPLFGGQDVSREPIGALKKRTYATEVSGDLIHVGTEAGVMTMSLANPKEPKELASITLEGSVTSLGLYGQARDRIMVTLGPPGVAILDASKASQGTLTLMNEYPWPAKARGGCHAAWRMRTSDGKKAYLACGTGGVGEADISDPSKLRVTRTMDAGDYVRDVVVLDSHSGLAPAKASSNKVIAAAGKSGLVVMDFEGKDPRVVSRFPVEGDARAVVMSGGLAYVADGPLGLRVVDLHDPEKPSELGRYVSGTVDAARSVSVLGTTVYLSAGESGLIIIDASTPSSPKKIGHIDPSRSVNRTAAIDSKVYVANDADGLLILDVANPSSPKQIFPKPD